MRYNPCLPQNIAYMAGHANIALDDDSRLRAVDALCQFSQSLQPFTDVEDAKLLYITWNDHLTLAHRGTCVSLNQPCTLPVIYPLNTRWPDGCGDARIKLLN